MRSTSSSSTEFKVGLFVMIALAIGGAVAFTIGSQRNLFRSKVSYKAVFDTVGGLRRGSPVRVAGVEVGSVDQVVLHEEGRIHVLFGVIEESAHLIRRDGVASIGNKGLLGDRLVDISVGEGPPIPPGGTVPTESPAEISQYLSSAGTILNNVEDTAENLKVATAAFAEEGFVQDVHRLTENLSRLTELAAREDGTVETVLADKDFARDLQRLVQTTGAAAGQLGQAAERTGILIDDIREKEGLLHALVYDAEGGRLITHTANVAQELATLMRESRTNEGLVHRLVHDRSGGQIVENLVAITRDTRAVVSDIRSGRGTLGGFVVDPSIYDDVKRLVGNLQRNEILRALVRYSIRNDEARGTIDVESE